MMEALTPSTIGEGAIQIGRDVDQVTTLSGSSWEQTFELDVRTTTPYIELDVAMHRHCLHGHADDGP